MADQNSTTIPCREGHERCAVDGVECECERIELEKAMRLGPSPTVARVMAKFCDRLGVRDEADQWRQAAEIPRSEGSA